MSETFFEKPILNSPYASGSTTTWSAKAERSPWDMEMDFASKVEQHFNEMIERVAAVAV